ncbi:S24 family peptidase [Merdibacter massiliensis]|uniref:S24 family peptidase n=1 Tax=Merdibacter massiliensis TaxID=1871030 RepID=UPI00096A9788|nr:S24 family peptidase [Merdibacter massiliensis]
MNRYLIDMLKKGRSKSGYTQAQVAEMLGIKGNTLSGYETGASEPDIDTYLQLCKIYDMDYVSILEKAYNLKPMDEIALSIDEQDHIKKYRSLDPLDKKAIDGLLDTLSHRQEQAKEFIEFEPPMLLPFYGHIVSAGTGQFVFDDIPPEMIEVGHNHINMQANFAVGVNGDSMEPTYSDGDVLLIKKQPSVNVGEIGIFMINGEAFVKEFAGSVLKSHNDKYEDIPITDQTICLGKVIGKHI